MLTIRKKFTFASAHKLNNPDFNEEWNKEKYGKCCELHGHSWTLFVEVRGYGLEEDELVASGMIINFVDLKEIVNNAVIVYLDHHYINDLVDFPPTCENLIIWIRHRLDLFLSDKMIALVSLELFESEGSSAIWRRND